MGSFGVRSYLFALLGVSTAVPVILFGLTQAERHARDVSVRHDEALYISATAAADRVGGFFTARKQDLELLAASVAASGSLTAEANRWVLDAHLRMSDGYAGTYLGNPQGRAVMRSPEALNSQDPNRETDYRDRDYFREVTHNLRTVFSRTQTGKVLEEPAIQVATPIVDANGTFLGYAEGSLALGRLKEILLESPIVDSREQVTLVDATGRVVIDSTRLAPLTDVSNLPLFSLAPNVPVRSGLGPSEAAMRGALVEVPGMPQWRVLAAAPESVVATLIANERRQVWLAAALTAGAAVLLSALLSTWLATRFRRLTSQIKAVGTEQRPRTVEYRPSWEPLEFRTLHHELALVAAELGTHRRGLEEKVETRTAELARTNEQLHFLVHALEHAEDGIAVTDDSGVFLYVNPALASITGYSATELLGKTAIELQLDPTDEAALAQRKSDLLEGRSHRASFTARRKDQTLFEQECTTWPIPGASGQALRYVTLRKDVTSQRRTEQSLRLSERMASLGTLAAGVAHEVNNPLTYVLLSLRLAQRQLDRHHKHLPPEYLSKTESALENALDGAERVSEIVKDLRVFSRVDETTVETIDPRSVLDAALRLMGSDIKHRAQLQCDYHSTPDVTGNRAKLHQVFLNLFINAVHAIEEAYGPCDSPDLIPGESPNTREALIRISTDTNLDGDCVIEVSDTGVGISPNYIDKIFDPFFTTKPVGVGTGLGLAMCRDIISAMAGEITVQSELGRGTTFRIVLPRARSISTSPQTLQTQRRARIASARVLVIDDSRAVGDSVSATLGEHHQVDVANSGDAALEKLRTHRYDVILCDLRMPNMNGIELFLKLREQGRGDDARMVFFSGGPVSDGTRAFLQKHGSSWIPKPFSEEQLEKAIRVILGEHPVYIPAQSSGHTKQVD